MYPEERDQDGEGCINPDINWELFNLEERIKGTQEGCIEIFGGCLVTIFSFADLESRYSTN